MGREGVDGDQENNLRGALSGGGVSRRWLLKCTAQFAAGMVVISSLGTAAGNEETQTLRGSGLPISGSVKEAPEAMIDIWDRF